MYATKRVINGQPCFVYTRTFDTGVTDIAIAYNGEINLEFGFDTQDAALDRAAEIMHGLAGTDCSDGSSAA